MFVVILRHRMTILRIEGTKPRQRMPEKLLACNNDFVLYPIKMSLKYLLRFSSAQVLKDKKAWILTMQQVRHLV